MMLRVWRKMCLPWTLILPLVSVHSSMYTLSESLKKFSIDCEVRTCLVL